MRNTKKTAFLIMLAILASVFCLPLQNCAGRFNRRNHSGKVWALPIGPLLGDTRPKPRPKPEPPPPPPEKPPEAQKEKPAK